MKAKVRNNEEKANTYFNIPLNFLRYIEQEEYTSKIIGWGIVDYSKRLSIDTDNMLKQFIYWMYNPHEHLPRIIKGCLYDLEAEKILLVDEDEYRGFNMITGFDPFDTDIVNKEKLVDYLNENNDVWEALNNFYRITQAIAPNALKLRLGSLETTYKNYKEMQDILEDYEAVNGTDAKFDVHRDLIFELMKNDLDPSLFKLYAACKSIIGNKATVKTTYDRIARCMLGFKSKDALGLYLDDDSETKAEYERLTRKNVLRKRMEKLVKCNLITKVSDTRGFYISKKLSKHQVAKVILEKAQRDAKKKAEKKKNDRDFMDNFRAELSKIKNT